MTQQQPPDQPGPPRCWPGRRVLSLLAALLLLATGCGSSGQGGEQGPDASAQVACADFRNVMRDVGQGILTDEELREKVKGIDRAASVSTQAGLASAGRAMLREVTTGTPEGFATAAQLFDQSCDEAGL